MCCLRLHTTVHASQCARVFGGHLASAHVQSQHRVNAFRCWAGSTRRSVEAAAGLRLLGRDSHASAFFFITREICGNPFEVSAPREELNEDMGRCEPPTLEPRVSVVCCVCPLVGHCSCMRNMGPFLGETVPKVRMVRARCKCPPLTDSGPFLPPVQSLLPLNDPQGTFLTSPLQLSPSLQNPRPTLTNPLNPWPKPPKASETISTVHSPSANLLNPVNNIQYNPAARSPNLYSPHGPSLGG